MATHDAEYFRQRRRVRGIRAREPFSAQGFMQRAIGLRRLEQQPWPKNLFGEPASLETMLAVATQLSEKADENPDNVCPCGCGRAHNKNVAQTLRNPYGRSFDVIYFWSEACKSKWNLERTRKPTRSS